MKRATWTFILISMVSASCFARVTDRQKTACVRQKIASRAIGNLAWGYRLLPSRMEVHSSYGPDAFLMAPGNLISHFTHGKFPHIDLDYVDFVATSKHGVVHGWVSIMTRPSVTPLSEEYDCAVTDPDTRKPSQIRVQNWGLYSDSTEIEEELLKQQQTTSALTAWTWAQRARQAQMNSSDESH